MTRRFFYNLLLSITCMNMKKFLHFFNFNRQFTASPFPYRKRRLNPFKTYQSKAIASISASVSQARQQKYAFEFMQALDDELLSLRSMECYRHSLEINLLFLKVAD